MGVTVQVRNLDPVVQETLKSRALKAGVSLSEYLRRTLTEIAEREIVHERWERAVDEYERERTSKDLRLRPTVDIDPKTVVEAVRSGRDERETRLEELWPPQR